MFLAHPVGRPVYEVLAAEDAKAVSWLDLVDPTEEEIRLAEAVTGLVLPRRDALEEIESSSRHYRRGDVIYLSTPLVRMIDGSLTTYPVGIVIAPNWLITLRYAAYTAIESMSRDLAANDEDFALSDVQELTIHLLETMVNRLADILENAGHTLDSISREVFAPRGSRERGRTANLLRRILRRLGESGDLASSIRESLLGVDRIGIYLGDACYFESRDALQTRLRILGRDVASLNDFVAQMTVKVQFLLDATLGFISIDQNDGMKLLTVVSFVGITPTLIAGVYGMNFRNMPELGWRYGYYYGLALMGASVLLPLLVFWRRGWFGDRST
ncbi:magnesium transporter CorA family protein [Swaminathania salitolerans]|uniref:Magnesium transport protein CorA n=1 Tax=Swaminathania salitolerans TaxID=182838 RepID=A0A511BRU4_9PROT|nr:magnesium transporter CorA family protein [Swaminathania salitolerans]GBQ12390.1 magnesium/cobalt transporter CorA [Swaminathania salitolerans LMG 21291]GEL02832.1 magnesium transport protein CorA [Swaminathania salitolerans]